MVCDLDAVRMDIHHASWFAQVTGKEQNNTQFAMCPAILIRLASAVCPF